MVVLSSSGEKVFRTDRSENTSTTKEKDASGGERDAVSSQLEENTVFSQSAGQNTGNGPLIEKELYPQISGIVISAQGGDLPSVQAEISQAMEALFGLEPHKIKVLKQGGIKRSAAYEDQKYEAGWRAGKRDKDEASVSAKPDHYHYIGCDDRCCPGI